MIDDNEEKNPIRVYQINLAETLTVFLLVCGDLGLNPRIVLIDFV